MLAETIQAVDTLSRAIPSFSDRFNFILPLVVLLIILMFFLLVKSYSSGHETSDRKNADPSRKTIN